MKKANKRIALIAHDFPPFNVGGSQRPYLMAKCLLQEGIDVTIFTLNKNHYPNEKLNFIIDEASLKIIRSEIDAPKSSVLNKGHYFNLTDNIASRWLSHLKKSIKEQHLLLAFDYLFITCPPFSMAVKAKKLSEYLSVPYILDFRDAWSQWIMTPYPSYVHYKRLLRIEKKAIENATFVSATSKQQINDFIKIHGKKIQSKFIYTPNGFLQYQSNNKPDFNSDKIKIVYTGSFYFNPYSQSLQQKKWYKKKWYQWFQYLPRVEDWSYRSPFYFFKALKKLFEINFTAREKIEVIFAGDKPHWFDNMTKSLGIKDNIQHMGFLNKHDTKALINSADYLLITSSKVIGGKEYSIAGKTFEYLASKKPILAFVNDGEQRDVLVETKSAYILDPDNIDNNAYKLNKIFNNKEPLILSDRNDMMYQVPLNFKQLIDQIKSS